jgi:hypothetical protein
VNGNSRPEREREREEKICDFVMNAVKVLMMKTAILIKLPEPKLSALIASIINCKNKLNENYIIQKEEVC